MLLMTNTILLTTGEIAEKYGVNRVTVWRWAAEGKLAPVQTAGKVKLFDPTEVADFVASRSS